MTDITSVGPLGQNEALFCKSSRADWIPKTQIPGIIHHFKELRDIVVSF
jgi:hypothetical protein